MPTNSQSNPLSWMEWVDTPCLTFGSMGENDSYGVPFLGSVVEDGGGGKPTLGSNGKIGAREGLP